MGKHNDDQVLSYGDAFLRKSDLSSLDPGKWLTDAVITFSFEYFEKEAFKDFIGNDDDSHQIATHSQSLNVSIPTYNTRSRAINHNRSLSTSLGTFASNPFLCALSDSNDMDSNQISNRSGSNRLNFAFVGPSTTQCVKLMPQEAPIILDPLNLFEKTHIFFVVNDLESPGTGGTHWSMLHWDRSAAFNRRPPALASIQSRDPDAMDVDDEDFETEGESDNGNEACVELLEHYDSIFGHNRHSAAIVYDILSTYLSLHYSNSPNEPPHRLEFVERFTPQQANGADCGVYVIALVEVLCRQLIERTTGCLSKSRSTTDLPSFLNGNSQSQAPMTRSHSRTAFANHQQQQQLHPAGGAGTTSGAPPHSAHNNSPTLPPGPVPSPYGTRLATRNQQLQALLADADAVEPSELSPDFIAAKRSEWRSRILNMRPAERPHV